MFNSKFTPDASDQLSERTLSRFPTMAFKGYVKLRRCQYSVVMNVMVVEDQKSPNKKNTHIKVKDLKIIQQPRFPGNSQGFMFSTNLTYSLPLWLDIRP